jgi:hypothetical protein
MNASAEERIALARRGIELYDAGDIESAFAATRQREGLVD